MDEAGVVTCFLRNRSDVLLCRRSDDVGSYPGRWGGVAGHVATDDGRNRPPEAAARAEIREETAVADSAVSLVRAGDPFTVTDEDLGTRWRVRPFLFDCDTRAVEGNWETSEYEWVSPTALLERETVPSLWTSYDRVRPRVATLREDRGHGSAWLSVRALEVLRDEAALAVAEQSETVLSSFDREADEHGWAGLAALGRDLLAARPSMAVVTNRVNRAMATASERKTPAALEDSAHEGIKRAIDADEAAATAAAETLPARVATLSRSGTVVQALETRVLEAVLVAESRPGREGVGVAERLAEHCDVTLTTDAAFPAELDVWGAEALVVGADRVLPDGRVLNKAGTRAAALGAGAVDVPCYVVAASDKIATDDRVDREERDPAAVYDGDCEVAVANPTFDVTPADAVEAVLTERGVLTDERLEAVVDEHRELAAWP